MEIKHTTTNRGFVLFEFKDRYDHSCSLQKSSLATEDAIWFGIDDPEPKILASVVNQVNPETGEVSGWVPYPIREEVHIATRMHLTREQVAALLPFLQKFVDDGELPYPTDSGGE